MAPRILITRPAGQHQDFALHCKALGFATELLPCMQIQPRVVSPEKLASLLKVSQTLLFTSANAVRYAQQLQPFPWPAHEVHAIGAATARILSDAGQPVSLTPQAPYNSEAYLEQLVDMPPASLLIIKGKGGRGLIQPHLEKLGWQVTNMDVYERVIPVVAVGVIDRLLTSQCPDIISVTSNEILDNLCILCKDYHPLLKQIPLVVNSQRCAERAHTLGFIGPVLVAETAGDTGQIACLSQWIDQLEK